MKPITLHPLSIVVGLALAGSAILLSGAAQRPAPQPATPATGGAALSGQIPGSWWTCVQLITDGLGNPVQTFTVPLDRYLVATYISGPSSSQVSVNGQPATVPLEPLMIRQSPYPYNIEDRNGTRIAYPPGAVLSSQNPGGIFIWGYLDPH